MLLDRDFHDRTQPVGLDGVKLDTDVAETFRPRVARFGRPRRQLPRGDLPFGDGDAFEIDFSIRRQLAQGFLDL